MNTEKQQEGASGGKTTVAQKTKKRFNPIKWIVSALIAVAAAILIVAMIIDR